LAGYVAALDQEQTAAAMYAESISELEPMAAGLGAGSRV
jgi:hypothetical protein